MSEKVFNAKVLISDMIERFHPEWAIAMSWGKESVAMLGLVREVYPDLDVKLLFTDTGKKPPETYAFRSDVEEMMGPVETFVYRSDQPLLTCEECKAWKAGAAVGGPQSFGLKALFVGIRADEHPALADVQDSEEVGGTLRAYPLLHWSEEDVWQYTTDRALPVHPLYAEGYRSLGCAAPCSVKVPIGMGERDGRDPEREAQRAMLRGKGYW